MEKLPNIQFLRFVAATMVFISHFSSHVHVIFGQQESTFESAISTAGSYGVDIFFVISGYVISTSYGRQLRSPIQFIKLRLFRIFPLYAACSLFFYFLHQAFPTEVNNSIVSKSLVLSSLTFMSKLFGFAYPILPQGWTLELEVFFYALFAIAICSRVPLTKGKQGILSALLIILAIIFGAPNIMLEFILGIMLSSLNKISRKSLIICIGLMITLYVAAAMSFLEMVNFRLLRIGIPALVVVALALLIPQVSNSFTCYLGDISYSVYLLHGMIIALLLKLFIYYNGHSVVLFFACAFVLTICLSSLTYFFFEKPIISFSKNSWG